MQRPVFSSSSFRVPPPLLLLGAMLSLQLGAAWGKELFMSIGVGATVFLRLGIGSLILLAIWRPGLRHLGRRDLWAVLGLGVALATMTFSFYSSIQFLPLGVAVALEFMGPLAVALVGGLRSSPTGRLWNVLCVLLAAVGVLLLSPVLASLSGAALDARGLGWVLLAAVAWAAYILMSARVGSRFEGGQGLALALGVAALCVSPFALRAGAALLEPDSGLSVLASSLMMALLSSVIPFSLEMEALRRMPTHVFSVLLSLEPALATLVGLVVLRETLNPLQLLAIGLVVLASGTSSWLNRTRKG